MSPMIGARDESELPRKFMEGTKHRRRKPGRKGQGTHKPSGSGNARGVLQERSE